MEGSREARGQCRVVVAGVGSPLGGDDRVGLIVAEKLRRRGYNCVVECPYGIELCAHAIRALSPSVLVVVDAALGLKPGEFRLVKLESAAASSVDWLPSTHGLSLRALANYILSLAENVYYLLVGVRCVGLSCESTSWLEEVSEFVAEFVAEIVYSLNVNE